MNKKLLGIVSMIILSLLMTAPVFAGLSGPGVTGINVQNLSTTDDATVNLDLYPQGGGTVVPLASNDMISKSSAKTYYLGNYPSIGSGSYSLVISSSQPAAAVARTDWSSTGGAAIYTSTETSNDIIIPLVTKAFANQTSQFTVQNTDTENDINDVVIKLFDRGSSTPRVVTQPQSIAKGSSKTWTMNDAIWGSLPNTGLDLGTTGYLGSIEITSLTPLVAQSFIDVSGSPAVAGFNGVAKSSASDTLYCPLVRANYYGDTGINIVNVTDNPITATIVFKSAAGSPNTGTYTQTLSVPANSLAIAFQGPGGNSRSAPTNLPAGTGQTMSNPTPTNTGFYGSATVTFSGGEGMAVVNDTKFGAGWAVKTQSSYNCVPAIEGGTKFALPLVRSFHLSGQKLTTGITFQNMTNNPVTVSFQLFNYDGSSQPCSPANLCTNIPIPANGSANVWSGFWTGLPTVPPSQGGYGWYGSAIVTATGGNITVEVSDEGYGSVAVDSANYIGLKIQ